MQPPDVLCGNDLQESAEAADRASSCAAQTDALLVAERQTCEDLRLQLQQLGAQASRADDLEQQLADAQQVEFSGPGTGGSACFEYWPGSIGITHQSAGVLASKQHGPAP